MQSKTFEPISRRDKFLLILAQFICDTLMDTMEAWTVNGDLYILPWLLIFCLELCKISDSASKCV